MMIKNKTTKEYFIEFLKAEHLTQEQITEKLSFMRHVTSKNTIDALVVANIFKLLEEGKIYISKYYKGPRKYMPYFHYGINRKNAPPPTDGIVSTRFIFNTAERETIVRNNERVRADKKSNPVKKENETKSIEIASMVALLNAKPVVAADAKKIVKEVNRKENDLDDDNDSELPSSELPTSVPMYVRPPTKTAINRAKARKRLEDIRMAKELGISLSEFC